MVAWPLAGGQYSCQLASEGTHLLDDGRPPLFVFVCVGVPPFVAVMLCFRHVGAIRVCHLLFAFIVVRSCVHIRSLSALFVGAVNLAKEVVGNSHLLWIVRALVSWQGGGYLLG